MTPVITSAMGGQPGTLIIGLSLIMASTGTEPVGLGCAACTPPQAEQLPKVIIAAAPAADSLSISSAVRPAIVQ